MFDRWKNRNKALGPDLAAITLKPEEAGSGGELRRRVRPVRAQVFRVGRQFRAGRQEHARLDGLNSPVR